MSNITIYWGAYPNPGALMSYLLNIEKPTPMMTELKKLSHYLNNAEESAPGGSFMRCPSVIETAKNTFVIKSPFDIDITYENGKVTSKFDNNNLQIRDHKSGFVSMRFIRYIFFTDKDSLHMRVRNAFYSINDFTNNCSVIEGSFDIAKWFRGIDCAFYFKRPGTISIKKGDALFYVEFQTTHSIELKKFMFTNELTQLHQYCLSAKEYNKFPLAEYFNMIYKLFRESKIKKQILKQINNNLLE